MNSGYTDHVSWGGNNGFSSTQPKVTINQPGTYWALVSNGACYSSDTVNVLFSNQSVTAYFIASTIDTVGKPVKFVDVSQPKPDNWLWDFGDGFTSTEQSPEHVFLTPQSYSVSLMVSNEFCTSKIVKSLQVFKLFSTAPKNNPLSLSLLHFSVFPNPATESFKTLLELNDAANIYFSVYDIAGKLVYQQSKSKSVFFDEETNIADLTNGLYLIEIVAENTKGFVRQKNKLLIMK